MNKIFELLKDAMNAGVEVTVRMNQFEELTYDVNTRAKSECLLKLDSDENIWVYGRYDNMKEIVKDPIDLYYFIERCACGRDYMDPAWVQVLEDNDLNPFR